MMVDDADPDDDIDDADDGDDVYRRKPNQRESSPSARSPALLLCFDHLQSSHLAAKLSMSSHRALLSNHTP
jgi:hypothetical protein